MDNGFLDDVYHRNTMATLNDKNKNESYDLCDCWANSESCQVCWLTVFCPCTIYASTKANNLKTSSAPKDMQEKCCGQGWWFFCAIQTLVPLTTGGLCFPCPYLGGSLYWVPAAFYANGIGAEKPCGECGDCTCCEWVCCFYCKATQMFKKSKNATKCPQITAPQPQKGMFRIQEEKIKI